MLPPAVARSPPNARGPLIVDFCLRIGYTTILLGTLGFFGLVWNIRQPPERVLEEGRRLDAERRAAVARVEHHVVLADLEAHVVAAAAVIGADQRRDDE